MRLFLITIIILTTSVVGYCRTTNEDLRNWEYLIGHELVFPQSNQYLYDKVFTLEALKKKQFDNKKYLADIDLQDIPVILKDVKLITVSISQNINRDYLYLILSSNGKDIVVPQMECYDKTEIDRLNSEYTNVYIHECPRYKSFNHTFSGIEYDKAQHCFYLMSDSDDKIIISPSKPCMPHAKFAHEHNDHEPSQSLCAIREALEYGTLNDCIIPQYEGKLIRY